MRLDLPQADVQFHSAAISSVECDRYFQSLLHDIPWQQDTIKRYGKQISVPRLTAWFGSGAYTYSGIQMQPHQWTDLLLAIKAKVEAISGGHFNSVLLNLYRNGNDSVSWHSDDEPELGDSPAIASLSFGATRSFLLKHKSTKQTIKLDLSHGSLLLMQGSTQTHWLHSVPKTKKPTAARINLTFRLLYT